MAEAPNDQQNEFKPDEAVAFLANFGHDPEGLKTRQPEEIKGLYEKTNGFLNTQWESKMKEVPTFREGWREALAADDPDDLKTLTRFTDPKQLWQRTKELNKKLSSGELKSTAPYPKDGKPEDQAAWRAERGIPAEPAKYMEGVKLKEGLVIGENDKPFVDSYLAVAHGSNLPPEAVSQQLNWYFGEYVPQIQQAQAEQDSEYRQEATTKLHEVWGADYKGNVNAVKAIVSTAPEGLRDMLFGSRTPDGRAFGDNPEVMQWLAGLSRELNPAGSLTGTGGENAMQGLNEKIAEYEGMMRTNRSAWNKDAAAQADYQKLLNVRANAKQKAA